jgi:ATP:corrinoid adenosyltransferase
MPDYRLPEAPPDEYAPVLDWELFMSRVFDWRQDQHVAVIGPTEQGKTNLIYHLLVLRAYVAYMAIKVRDATLEAFASQGGYQVISDWPPLSGRVRKRPATWEAVPRRLVWPDASDRRIARAEQQRVFHAMLDDVWRDGCTCVVWDDFWYLVRLLGLELDAKQMLLNARSNDSPQVIAAQRGAGNRMVELFDQPTWLFFARETDARNLQLLGPSNSIRRGFVANLDRYQFYVENTRTDQKYRVTAPLLKAS